LRRLRSQGYRYVLGAQDHDSRATSFNFLFRAMQCWEELKGAN
jgi:hypothetical protein